MNPTAKKQRAGRPAEADSGQQGDKGKRPSGRQEHKGIAPDRNRYQKPPAWPDPAGTAAAELLADLLRRRRS
jgi:hypothetical protein